MLETISAIATILGFLILLFVEWPRIQQRWAESYSSFEKLLISISIFIFFLGIIASLLIFTGERQLLLANLSATLCLFGLSMLIFYWVENKSFAYKRSAGMAPIWIYIVAMFLLGLIGVSMYLLGLA